MTALPFKGVWAVDFEYIAKGGGRPSPICLVAQELKSGETIKVWQDQLLAMKRPPFPIDADNVLLAYYASAELSCFLVLGWPMPERVIDLFVEFRCQTNGLTLPAGAGLLGALAYFGLDAMSGTEKADLRDLVLRGGPWSGQEREDIVAYCSEDVFALGRLLPALEPKIVANRTRLSQSLLRGRYMVAAAKIEHAGVPLDLPLLERLRTHWDEIRARLVQDVDRDFGVFEGTTFKRNLFEAYLADNDIPWPRLAQTGVLALDRDTFKSQAQRFPQIVPLFELRKTLAELRLTKLQHDRLGQGALVRMAVFRCVGRSQAGGDGEA